MSTHDAWTVGVWVGDAEQCEAIRQYARDYDWSGTEPRIEDPEHAADEAVDAIDADRDMHPAARSMLRAALIVSAERENSRRENA